MEASLNGCGKLLDKINALHTTFSQQPEAEYEGHGITKFELLKHILEFFYFHLSSSCS